VFKGLSFLRLTLLFLIFLALRTLSTRRSKNQKPPSQPQKILRLSKKQIYKDKGSNCFPQCRD